MLVLIVLSVGTKELAAVQYAMTKFDGESLRKRSSMRTHFQGIIDTRQQRGTEELEV